MYQGRLVKCGECTRIARPSVKWARVSSSTRLPFRIAAPVLRLTPSRPSMPTVVAPIQIRESRLAFVYRDPSLDLSTFIVARRECSDDVDLRNASLIRR